MQPTAQRPSGKPSSAAPPSYRPKKKNPLDTGGESSPMPQNKNRLTGPPMQQGPGQGSMFANGRPGGRSPVPYGAPPATPNYPRPSMGPSRPGGERQGVHPAGNKTAVMFADGGFGAPPAIGGMPDDDDSQMGAPVGADDDQGDAAPPQQGGGMPPIIKPEAVNFHDDLHSCGPLAGGPGCQYMGQDGMCAVLQMQVQPQSGCSAFEPMAGGGEDQTDISQGMPTGASMAQNPDGTSGNPSMS